MILIHLRHITCSCAISLFYVETKLTLKVGSFEVLLTVVIILSDASSSREHLVETARICI